MDDPQRWVLSTINHNLIVTELYIEQVKDYMLQGGFINSDDFQTLQNSADMDDEAQAGEFLDLLVTQEPAAFDTFCGALKETGLSHISEKLRHDADILAHHKKGDKIAVDAITLKKLLQDNGSLQETKTKARIMEKELITLEMKNIKLSNKLNKVRRKSNELWEENHTVRGEQAESQKILDTVTQLFEDSKSHIKEVKNERNNLEKRVVELEARLKLHEAGFKIIEQERKELEDHALEQEVEYTYQEGMISKLKLKIDEKDDELRELSQSLANHKGEVTKLEESIAKSNQKIADLESELGDVKRKLEENKVEKDELVATSQEQEEYLANQENKIGQYMQHLNDIKSGLALMNDTIAQISDEKQELERMVTDRELIVQKLQMNLENLSKLSTNREVIIQHLNWRIQTLLSDKDLAEKEIVSANRHLQRILLQHISLAQTVMTTQNGSHMGQSRCL